MKPSFSNQKVCLPPISGVILAGGLGRRMGCVDKGLQDLQGRPLVAWVLERMKPQVDEILINANQNRARYATFGERVMPDLIANFAGPLAGLHAALTLAKHPLLATAPCDSPFLPSDLVSRLYAGLTATDADLAVVRTGEQLHPVFCLCKTSLLANLSDFLAAGNRKFGLWTSSLATVEVCFDDQPHAFENINTLEELQLQQR